MRGAPSPLYEPLNEYKPFGPNIGVVDGPLEYLTMAGVRLPLPFTTRMTVVRLASGDLFLHSPIAFNAELTRQLSSMGAVCHLVSPNQFHYARIGEWSHAFPDAITWASPHARERARARGIKVQFKRDLSTLVPDEWRNEIDQTTIPGGIFGEFVFFHKESRTLILTDAIINFELDKLAQPWRFATRVTGMYYPHGQIFLACVFRFSCRSENRKLPSNGFFRGSPSVSLLATGAVLNRMLARFSGGYLARSCRR